MAKAQKTVSHDQKWFHLAIILGSSFTFPMLSVIPKLTHQYGTEEAIYAILIGNLLLWLIGLVVISMAREDSSNAIENVRAYLGKYGALVGWFVLMVAILNWFVHQLNGTLPSIGAYFGQENTSVLLRLGAGIGFFTTLLSIGGIRLIKWAALLSFPFVFFYHLFFFFQSSTSINSLDVFKAMTPPVSAIIAVIFILLPGTLNLPTFFRHARSKADACLALTLMTFITILFEITALWADFTTEGLIQFSGSSLFSLATVIFMLITLVYINLINIYYASACWETYVPKFEGAKGYAITGLLGTAAYTFIQAYTPIQYIAALTNCYLASLGLVLLLSYLIRFVLRHRPRPLEQTLNCTCWFVGCIVATILVIQNVEDDKTAVLMGIGASILAYLIIIFVEETLWAARELFYKK